MKNILKKFKSPEDSVAALFNHKHVELTSLSKTTILLKELDESILGRSYTLEEVSLELCRTLVYRGNFAYAGVVVKPAEHSFGSPHVALVMRDSWVEGHKVTILGSKDLDQRAIFTALEASDATGGALDITCLPGPIVYKITSLVADDPVVIKLLSQGCDSYLFFSTSVSEYGDSALTMLKDGLRPRVSSFIENAFLIDELQRVTGKLKRTNEKLTALDSAKDEFISMASHQLRTPLTSVKGYLSMVLEGDVGKITRQQKEMLLTAFSSAERMVFLIGDLLNVSRLQTGKFVIEPVDCYLPDAVTDELKLLEKSLEAKNIKLSFDKPTKFPTLQLDDTKIRQVIVNFVDNALYYTPPGGEITLQLINKPNKVEFTVTDNGMGVPKADQHKLFTKFYRASNAQKARPDGTGLGLFMAKKVIIGSGGVVIFKSKEGKGSTFGFSLPKD